MSGSVLPGKIKGNRRGLWKEGDVESKPELSPAWRQRDFLSTQCGGPLNKSCPWSQEATKKDERNLTGVLLDAQGQLELEMAS